MNFGLMTGSYAKNTGGGVLRQKMGAPGADLSHEINTTDGTFKSFEGIIETLNRLRNRISRGPGYEYNGTHSLRLDTSRADHRR